MVEHFTQRDGQWTLSASRELDDVLRLPSIGCEVPLKEIYDRVEFPPEGPLNEAAGLFTY
jgi:hypothetical protein